MNITERVAEIAEIGVHDMVRKVQDHLGITEGDIAGQHFSDEKLETYIRLALLEYVAVELQFKITELEEGFEEELK